MSWFKRSATKEDKDDRRTSVTEDLESADGAVKKTSERSQADQSGTNEGEGKAKGEKKGKGGKDKAKGDQKKEDGKAKGDKKKRKDTAVPSMSAESDPNGGFTTVPQQGGKELSEQWSKGGRDDFVGELDREPKAVAPQSPPVLPQDEASKCRYEIHVTRLEEKVSELEACKKKELEEYNEKIKWQMDRLMKCDKEKESLEKELHEVKAALEEAKNNHGHELKKKDEELATLEGKLNTQEKELHEVKAALEEANNNHGPELKKKDEDCDRMRHEWEELLNRCKDQNAELVKQTEVKVIECDKQMQEITRLQDQVLMLTRKCEASQNHDLALELELKKEKDEHATKVQLLLEENNQLQSAFEDEKAKCEKIHEDMQVTKWELERLKEDNQQYQKKVEERDKRIDQLSRTAKSERKYIKSDNEDAILCDKVCELVEHYTRTCPDSITLQSKIEELEDSIEQSTVQSVDHNAKYFTQQSPTASLMPVRSISLREALQFNETESTNLKEEIMKLKVELEMYQSTNKKQSQALHSLKEELNIAKDHLTKLEECKHHAEQELRSLQARTAAQDSLNNKVLVASDELSMQVQTAKNEKEALEKEQVVHFAKIKSLNKELTELKVQLEVIQVALKGSDTEHALVEKKLKQEMSTIALQNKKLQENYKKVCVELADVTEKNKSLEEHIGVLQTQVDVYKSDFDNERSDRERMAHEIEKKSATANATKQRKGNVVVAVSYKSEDEDIKQKQLDSLQEVYDVALRKIRDLENEISDLKEQIQTFISKEEASKRSLEEAIATSSKLNEEVMVLTQQVKQYKKQADNLRSQVEKYELMNKSHVEQQAEPAYFVPQSQAGEPDANYHHQMKQSAQQAYQMHQVRQPHHEDAYAHHLMGEVTPAAGFPLRASPSDNAYPQGYAYQPPQGLAPTPGQGLVPSRSPPPPHHPKQEALHDEDDDLPPPILTPFQQVPNSQIRSPVRVRAASEQPLSAPYQHYHQPQSQPPVRYPHTTMAPGPQRYDDPHYQQEWQHAADAQGYAQPRVGLSAPQPHWPVQNNPHVMPGVNDPHLVQDVELAKGIGSDISSAMVKLQAGEDKNGSSSGEAPPDPNLVCPVCRNAFRKGEIQKYRRHVETCGKQYS